MEFTRHSQIMSKLVSHVDDSEMEAMKCKIHVFETALWIMGTFSSINCIITCQ
jgi:hypothetical protein